MKFNEDEKKYFLKIPSDFFNNHDIKLIENIEDGHIYLLTWIKLLTFAARQKNPNILKLNDNVIFTPKLLSSILSINQDHIEKALKIFLKLDIINIDENHVININYPVSFFRSESNSAERVRKFREKQKKSLPSKNSTREIK